MGDSPPIRRGFTEAAIAWKASYTYHFARSAGSQSPPRDSPRPAESPSTERCFAPRSPQHRRCARSDNCRPNRP
jgi:hypothetical protein